MKLRKNILMLSLVFTGILLTSKTHSTPVLLNSKLDLNKCSLNFHKNLNKVNSKILAYSNNISDNHTELNIGESGIFTRFSPKNDLVNKIKLKQLGSDLVYNPFTVVNYITHNTSSILAKQENLIQNFCNDNPLSGDQNPRIDIPFAFEGENNLKEIKVDTSFSPPAFFQRDTKNCDWCLSRHDYQHPKFPSQFTSSINFDTLELRLESEDSISKVIHEMNCQQEWEEVVTGDLKEIGKTIGDLVQSSDCDFNIDTIEDKNILEVSAEKKNFIVSKNKEIELIAKTIWGEGRGESYEGKVAIGNVIINRYKISQATRKSHWWGKTIEQIILHPYQFSCHNYNDPNKNKIAKLTTQNYQYRESLKIAKGILSGAIKDNTFGATHYFAYKTVQPPWASKMKKTKRIGNHDFYRK